jgi:apolipoprotein N-acyltransferase
MARKKDIILALSSGVLLVLGFPPFDFYPVAWIALVPLLVSQWDKNARTAFLLGTLTGFVYFLGTIYWVFHSMYYYGNIPAVLSALLLVLLSFYLGIYVGVFSILFNFLTKNSKLPALFVAPVLWVTLEFLRTYALTGFPWSVLGYSQYKLLPLIQIADITGVYGISFLIVALNVAIFDATVSWPKRLGTMPLYGRMPFTLSIIAFAAIIVLSVYYSKVKLNESDTGSKIKVSVIQGNIAQDKKWDLRFQKEVIDTYKRLSMNVSAAAPDMIVWPETALPFTFGYNESLSQELITFQRTYLFGNPYLLFGSVIAKDAAGNSRMANSAVLMSPEGDIVSVYDKIHLVPYGEYVPLRNVFPFIRKLTAGIGDFVPGKETVVMKTPFAKISNLICYEIIFPGLVRKFVNRGANVLVTITNDAWFGRTSAPYQHFSMAVFRAIENRTPIVRSANTGISGFIDSTGRIKRKSDIFVETVMSEDVVLRNETSFYTKFGDIFTFLCIICTVLIIINKLTPLGR